MGLQQNIRSPITEKQLGLISDMLAIQTLERDGGNGIERLVDYLTDDREPIVAAALKRLHALHPMATLPLRIREDASYRKNPLNNSIPDWLVNSCDGWGTPGDFIRICLHKLDRLNQDSDRDRFLQYLATFMGAQHRILILLKKTGQLQLARKFARIVFRMQQKQFPKQATLALTMNCQLTCGYCISGQTSSSEFGDMSLTQIDRLLEWMQAKGIHRLGLTGGEPTLFKNFELFLRQIKDRKLELYLATNGLSSERVTAAIVRNSPMCVTMHLTSEVLTTNKLNTYIHNAKQFKSAGIYAIMRCNFLDTDDDPKPYLNIAKEVGISEIRTAIPMPRASGGNQFVDRSQLKAYAKILDDLVIGGRQTGISIRLAKPFPVCFMARETARQFLANGSLAVACPIHFSGYTNNVIVHSDLRYTACLGLDELSEEPLIRFNSLAHAAGSYRNRVRELIQEPLMEACQECPLWKGARCLGGCLSYRISEATQNGKPRNGGL